MVRKLFGLLMILAGATGLVISAAGLMLIRQTPNYAGETMGVQTGQGEVSRLSLAKAIDIAAESAQDASSALEALHETTLSLADVVSNTQPSLVATHELITDQLPASLEAIQSALPTLQTAAGSVDETLRQVSEFEALFVALGLISAPQIQYDPEVPLADSVATLGESLEGIPERLYSMDPLLDQIEQDTALVHSSILVMGDEIQALNEDLARLIELTEELEATSESLDTLLRVARPVATFLLIWLAVSQLAPIYMGFTAISTGTGKRRPEEQKRH
jgi:hypothetical protein